MLSVHENLSDNDPKTGLPSEALSYRPNCTSVTTPLTEELLGLQGSLQGKNYNIHKPVLYIVM